MLLIVMAFVVACSFGDINVDPNKDADATMREILPAAIVQTARNTLSIGGRVAGIIVQHFEGVDAQPLGYNNYLVDEQTLSDYWDTGLYSGSMKDCQLIIEKAAAANQPYYEGIAKILMAYNLGLATSMWGDVPFTAALKGTASIQSAYDPQEVVYEQIQLLLDQALEALGRPAEIGGPSDDDLIFNGDNTKWQKTAHALKARYYLHLSKQNPSLATLALDQIAQAFDSRQTQPQFNFANSDNESNPLALFGKERPQQLEIGIRLGEIMNAKNDPRRSKYWLNIQGKREIFVLDTVALERTQRSSPLSLITYEELLFIQAEAMVRADVAGSSQIFTKGILQSMESLGVTSQQYNPYLAFNGGLGSSLSQAEKIEKIISEKYVALYGLCGDVPHARYRPFCSRRCADVDLHRWLGGVYRMPTQEVPDPDLLEAEMRAAERRDEKD
jgi:endogenous inhibitor of DNA gyrase (YacG/DUF329 family)